MITSIQFISLQIFNISSEYLFNYLFNKDWTFVETKQKLTKQKLMLKDVFSVSPVNT